MAPKKDNLPLSLEKDDASTNSITYANEVIAIIAGVAANEVEGIAGMCTSGGISEVFGRNKNITKGVRVEIGTEEASVDLYVIVEYGTPIQTAAMDVQENVRKAIETMTGLHVVRVDVHVQGVSFEKENKELQAGLENAKIGGASEKKREVVTTETTSETETHSEITWDTADEQPAQAESVSEVQVEIETQTVEIDSVPEEQTEA